MLDSSSEADVQRAGCRSHRTLPHPGHHPTGPRAPRGCTRGQVLITAPLTPPSAHWAPRPESPSRGQGSCAHPGWGRVRLHPTSFSLRVQSLVLPNGLAPRAPQLALSCVSGPRISLLDEPHASLLAHPSCSPRRRWGTFLNTRLLTTRSPAYRRKSESLPRMFQG